MGVRSAAAALSPRAVRQGHHGILRTVRSPTASSGQHMRRRVHDKPEAMPLLRAVSHAESRLLSVQ